MRNHHRGIFLVLALVAGSCGTTSSVQRPAGGPADAGNAVRLLQEGKFAEAAGEADQVLAKDERNAQARLVRALTRYKQASHQLSLDLRTVLFTSFRGGINHQYLRWAVNQADAAFMQTDADLEVAARDHGVSLELCLACWQVDWNQNGRMDDNDARLFQIEIDAAGHELPDDDPRRKPTFRFDLGDIYWARAMLSFQRAVLNLLLAYGYQEIADQLLADKKPTLLRLPLKEPERVAQARKLILAGLSHADRCRQEYLAETDDDREWVPNPRQKSHPLPLPVDGRLYETWEGVVGDVRRLVAGEEGLSVAELAQLGRHQWEVPPQGFLDLGALLSRPRDIVIDLNKADHALDRDAKERIEAVLADLLGEGYSRQMHPSPLIKRLTRMRNEMERGEESFERKLRYLLWLN